MQNSHWGIVNYIIRISGWKKFDAQWGWTFWNLGRLDPPRVSQGRNSFLEKSKKGGIYPIGASEKGFRNLQNPGQVYLDTWIQEMGATPGRIL